MIEWKISKGILLVLPGGYNFPGTRPPGPQNFNPRGGRAGMMPRPGYSSGHVMGGYPGGHGQVGMGPGQGSAYHPYHHHYPYHAPPHLMHHPPGGWAPPPPGGPYPPPPPEYGAPLGHGYGHPSGYMMDGMEWTGAEWVRTPDRKGKVRCFINS